MKTPTSKAGKEMSLGCIDSDEISKKAKKRSCFWYHYMLQRDVLYEIQPSIYSVMTANTKDAQSQSQHPPTQLNLKAADEAVLNKVLKKELNKNFPLNVE